MEEFSKTIYSYSNPMFEKSNEEIVSIKFEIDKLEEAHYQLDINTIYNFIPIKIADLETVYYYIACGSAEIKLEIADGSILDYTKDMSIPVNYRNSRKKTRESCIRLKPTIKNNANEDGLEGEVVWQSGEESQFDCSFDSEERQLASIPQNEGKGIKWALFYPRGEKAILDFLFGNLWLTAKCLWNDDLAPRGVIEIKPLDISFFNSDRRRLHPIKNIFMRAYLWKIKKSKSIVKYNQVYFNTEAPSLD